MHSGIDLINKCAMATITHLTPNEQAYVFLWRYKDMDQKAVYALQKEFYTYTKGILQCSLQCIVNNSSLGKPELEEFDVVRLLEYRGTTKTSTELRKDVTDMLDKSTHKLAFIQLCCHVFQKPYRRFIFNDEESRDKAVHEASSEANEPEAAKTRFLILQQVEDEAKQRRKAEEELKECVEEGVASKAAFFKKKMVIDEKKAIEMKVSYSFYFVYLKRIGQRGSGDSQGSQEGKRGGRRGSSCGFPKEARGRSDGARASRTRLH